jgi:polyhydroxybutyrate depolymerase
MAKNDARPSSTLPPSVGRRWLTIRSGGYDREVHVQVPTAAAAEKPLPLVLLFHGAGGGGERFLDQNGWADKAEEQGFIAAAPDGLAARPHRPPQYFLNPRLWNDGQLRPDAIRVRIDDTAFVRTLIGELRGRWNIDPGRVFAAGHSNGAGMVFRIGTELADSLTAIAAVSGHCWVERPRPSRRLPLLYIVGTKDPLIPIEGGDVALPWGKKTNPQVRRTIETWAEACGLAITPRAIADDGIIKIELYGEESERVFIKAVYVQGQGHGWPGGREPLLPERFTGPNLRTFDAASAIWDFFAGRG